ncbi:MAG: Gfo/Idh/MocA family oxidoreductase [Nostocoides sp.]
MSHGLRLGVIGAGTITQSVHLESARRAGFTLTRVCDLSLSRAAEVSRLTGAGGTTDPAQVYGASDVDAVLIATPGRHAPLAVAALSAGKHVLIEKPVALSRSEIDAVSSAATNARRVAQVGYMKMYDPLMSAAAADVAALAGVRLVRITVQHPADALQIAHLRMAPPAQDADADLIAADDAAERAEVAAELPWAGEDLRTYYRNVLNGSVIHEFSVLRALGLPLPTRWTAEVFPELGGSEPASLLATATVGSSRYVLSWNWLPNLPAYEEDVTVLGTDGTVTLELARPYQVEAASVLTTVRAAPEGRRSTRTQGPAETGFLRQLDEFARCITTGAAPRSNLDGAARDLDQIRLLAEAIDRSHRELAHV